MAVNERYPLAGVLDACRAYHARRRRRVFIEYVMLAGVNDRYEQALALARLLDRRAFKVNLIPFNPTDTAFTGSGPQAIAAFASALRRQGIPTTVRLARGRDIDAACGQLAARAPAGAGAAGVPAGPAGAHRVGHAGEGIARVLMFSSAREPAVAVYPDSDKIGVWPGNEADHVMLHRADGHGPRMCALSGQDVDKLRRIGAETLAVIGHTAVVTVALSMQANQLMRSWWGNQELREVTQAVYAARHLAMREVTRQARDAGLPFHRG